MKSPQLAATTGIRSTHPAGTFSSDMALTSFSSGRFAVEKKLGVSICLQVSNCKCLKSISINQIWTFPWDCETSDRMSFNALVSRFIFWFVTHLLHPTLARMIPMRCQTINLFSWILLYSICTLNTQKYVAASSNACEPHQSGGTMVCLFHPHHGDLIIWGESWQLLAEILRFVNCSFIWSKWSFTPVPPWNCSFLIDASNCQHPLRTRKTWPHSGWHEVHEVLIHLILIYFSCLVFTFWFLTGKLLWTLSEEMVVGLQTFMNLTCIWTYPSMTLVQIGEWSLKPTSPRCNYPNFYWAIYITQKKPTA